MSTIKGIFEPFKQYVQDQLRLREDILQRNQGRSGKALFYTYTSNKSCVITMASGVDIIEENDLLEANERNLVGNRLAERYVLTPGNGIPTGNSSTAKPRLGTFADYKRATLRSNQGDGHGPVPLPGIQDATIQTLSDDGSLRQATVRFRANNRRQLEVLEALYMRPGYPILIEWGWVPYITADGVEQRPKSILKDFLKGEETLNSLNKKIVNNKIETEGNYDALIGFCKNFEFTVTEDGGYDCTTEIISQGDILASLKSRRSSTPMRDYDPGTPLEDEDLEIADDFTKFLRSIRANLNRAGDATFLKASGEKERLEVILDIEEQGFFEPDKNYGDPVNDEIKKLNTVHPDYSAAFDQVKKLIKDILKVSDDDFEVAEKELTEDTLEELGQQEFLEQNSFIGIDSMLFGTILKQVVHNTTNGKFAKKGDPKYDSGYKKEIFVRWDLIVQIINYLSIEQYKDNEPIVEMTCGNPGKDIINLNSDKILDDEIERFYLNYSSVHSDAQAQAPYGDDKLHGGKRENLDLLGSSYNSGVCLMPHQPIFDNLISANSTTRKTQLSSTLPTDAKSTEKYGQGGALISNTNTTEDEVFRVLSSYKDVDYTKNSIGLVYFNLDHLIARYEELRFEEYKTDINSEEKTKRRLKDEFNFLDYMTTIWNDVNEACGGFYDFGLHVEHERPHVGRIIDFTVSGDIDPKSIYTFTPQDVRSVSRKLTFNSKLDSDFASTISIAAQSPDNIHSLEAMSFKSFHKNIKNRFTSVSNNEENESREIKATEFDRDKKEYHRRRRALGIYLTRLNTSRFSLTIDENIRERKGKYTLLSPESAINYAQSISELRTSILGRYEFTDEPKGEYKGFYRPDTTHERSAIIPLEFEIEMDGISGMLPLQLFKINKRKLPLGYQRDDIAFVIKSEKHTITDNQDWTVALAGQLTLLNTRPNIGPVREISIDNLDNSELNAVDTFPDDPYADALRYWIGKYNHEEKIINEGNFDDGPQLSNNGDISRDMYYTMREFIKFNAEYQQFFNFQAKYPEVSLESNQELIDNYKHKPFKFRFTAGNDVFHSTRGGNHPDGNAIDLVLLPTEDRPTITNKDLDDFIDFVKIFNTITFRVEANVLRGELENNPSYFIPTSKMDLDPGLFQSQELEGVVTEITNVNVTGVDRSYYRDFEDEFNKEYYDKLFGEGFFDAYQQTELDDIRGLNPRQIRFRRLYEVIPQDAGVETVSYFKEHFRVLDEYRNPSTHSTGKHFDLSVKDGGVEGNTRLFNQE